MTKEELEHILKNHDIVKPKLEILRLAEEINPEFKNPHIVGGFLRNIILDAFPRDCDVIFQGHQLNQPGILEAVQEAEKRLGIEPYPDWEFENTTATGRSGDIYEDNVGKYTHHTDYLTMLIMDTKGNLHIGGEKTLHDLEHRIYDLHFPGVYIWATHRGGGRSFFSCLSGDLIRAYYLSHVLKLTPSATSAFLMGEFDNIFNNLNPGDQQARLDFWFKKTHGDPAYQPILDKYGVTVLKIKLAD
ncbi:hypothetical protein HYW46_03235 [Candidatus Daviesbacteria bacterium]|nr:hypothetical protein [Candidatus Daviesbacteria bacterium]